MKRMNQPFEIRGKLPKPLSLEQIAEKYELKDSDIARIRAFVLPGKKVLGGKGKSVRVVRQADQSKKAAR